MKNLKLIISREYLTRVKKKSFIITTLITPLAIGLFIFVLGFILNYSSGEDKTIAAIASDLSAKMYNLKILKKNSIIILHRHKKEEDIFPKNFKIIEEKKYGISKIIFGGIIMSFGMSSWGGNQFFIIPIGLFIFALPFFNKNHKILKFPIL